MATLQQSESGKAANGKKGKFVPKVDLTAMVDLAFLLITFFMLTTSLSKQNVMDIAKPVPIDDIKDLADWPASKTMTILLGKNNNVVCYKGTPQLRMMKVGKIADLGAMLSEHKRMVAKQHTRGSDGELFVIIKPTKNSVYSNFVDALDELNINNIKIYAIDDRYFLADELAFMKAKGI